MTRSIQIGEYRFIEEGKIHAHELLVDGEWKPLIGVSSVVKNITEFSIASYYGSRRALMELGYDPKMAKKEVAQFREKATALCALEDKELSENLYKCYTAHATYSNARAKKGTNSHDIIDQWIKKCIAENNGYPIPIDNPLIDKFIALTRHLAPRFVASEKHGYNKDLWIGGITDVIVDTNIGLGIWDNKDRPAIYGKDILQMGGYTLLFDMPFTHVLGIPLEGEETRIFYDVPQLQEAYKAQIKVYKLMQSLEPKK